MSDSIKRREEVRKQIRETSRQEFMFSEMKRLGFWKVDVNKPSLPEILMERKMELQKEIRELATQQQKVEDPEKLLKAYRKKRLEESREKQKANREKREQEKKQRATNWQERKANEILYLGEDISGGLHEKDFDAEKLKKFDLPQFEDAAALAKAIGISTGHLRFLSWNRNVSRVSHYQRFYMQKKSGGKRLISAPMPLMKKVQYWILENILENIPTHPLAHGFKKDCSIVSNAKPHLQQDVVINLDFKDFFPTINFRRVKGVFVNFGYSEHIATILAAICTEPEVDQVKMDGVKYFVAKGERVLPQGAPTSPVLTNILGFKLDKRLEGVAKSLNFNYTRYADDLTFSAKGDAAKNVRKLLWRTESVTKDEGFLLHPDKLRIMHKGSRQEVTGIVVNDELGIERKTLRKFRALLHQIEQTGWEGKRWGKSSNLPAAVWGYANFVFMVKPEKGKALLEKIKMLMQKSGMDLAVGEKPESGFSLEKKIKEEQGKIQKSDEEKKDGDSKWKMW